MGSRKRKIGVTIALVVFIVVAIQMNYDSRSTFISSSSSSATDDDPISVRGTTNRPDITEYSSTVETKDYLEEQESPLVSTDAKHVSEEVAKNLLVESKAAGMGSASKILSKKHPPYTDSLLPVPNGIQCFRWHDDDEKSDHWWTHHPLWSVSFENDTHSCFRSDILLDPYYIKVYANQFLSDCSNVTTRYMWDSG